MTAPLRLASAPPLVPEEPLREVYSYTAGFTDELGDRQLAIDPAAGTSVEVLQFKREFADSPEFEAALRARVAEVSHLPDSAFAVIQSVVRTEGLGLSLVSNHASGRRVSEFASMAQGVAFALEFIRVVTSALAMLQRTGNGVVHGALSAERIIVTRDGRLVVVEHVLGSAIEALNLPRHRLNGLGLVAPDGSDPVRFDGRTDMMQLGFIALSLLLGRRLAVAEYPARVPALLDEFVRDAGSSSLSGKMRGWLERAMQISPTSFASAREAEDALGDLPNDVEVQVAESAGGLLAFPSEAPATPGPEPKPHHHEVPQVSRVDDAGAREPADSVAAPRGAPTRGLGRAAGWIIAVLSLLAAGEAFALFVLPYLRPVVDVIEVRSLPSETSGTLGSAALLPTTTASGQAAVGAPGSGDAAFAPSTSRSVPPASVGPVPPVAAGPRFGGLTVSSPIDLQVFKDGTLVGSTTGPIAVNEGTHNLQFVNETLGFRVAQAVSVKGGLMTSVKIAVPNGRISINAEPWAEVTIDGTPAGETPLANISVAIGTHEIVFRHPQLGERRQTVVVKVDALVRVTQSFRQDFKR